jgi:hypothetical protein
MKSGSDGYAALFFTLFGAVMLLIALEEIAWGQSLLGFETPALFERINEQQETTLHNIGPLQGKSELFRLAFGLAGLVGLLFNRSDAVRRIAVPPVLFPWFLIISGHAALDIFNDIHPIQQQFDAFMQRTSELIELFIALAGFFYVYIRAAEMTDTAKQD